MKTSTDDFLNRTEKNCDRNENTRSNPCSCSALHAMFDASMRDMRAVEMHEAARRGIEPPAQPRCVGTSWVIDPARGGGHYWYHIVDGHTVISSMDLFVQEDASFCTDTVDFVCFGLYEHRMPAYMATSARKTEALIGYVWKARSYVQRIGGGDRLSSTAITLTPEALATHAAELGCCPLDIAHAIGGLDGTRDIRGLPTLFRELAAARPSARFADAYYRAKVNEALTLLLDGIERDDASRGAPCVSDEGIVADACALVDGRLGDDLSTRAISAALHVSVSTLIEAFHAVKGTTPQAHVRSARIERAKVLLAGGDESIASVAACVGYRNQGAFSEAFRRCENVTPRQFRRMAALQQRRSRDDAGAETRT